MRSFSLVEPLPFSVRFLLDDDLVETVVDVVDSALLATLEAVGVVRFVRLALEDKDETFVVRGRLSIDDCDDAVKI